MSRPVEIGGGGLAELTCARLLAGRGHRIRLPPPGPGAAGAVAAGAGTPGTAGQGRTGPGTAGSRPLLLTGPALELLDSLWGPGLLDGTWEVTHRQVRWGDGPPARFAQPGRVVDGVELALRMRERLAEHDTDPGAADPWEGPPCWVVTARADRPPARSSPWGPSRTPTGGEPAGAPVEPAVPPPVRSPAAEVTPEPERVAGRRRLLAGTAPLRVGADERTAVLGTAEGGWAHLTPLGCGAALVQAMVPGPAGDPVALLARLAAETGLGALLRRPPRSATAIPAAPLLHPSPATAPAGDAPGRLLVGAGAIRYDPLSGTGTAQALRTGILAAAVVDAAARGSAPPRALCAHYAARLRAAYAEHQRSCARLYGSAFPGPAWSDELDAARACAAPSRG
ncbi:hypothetical protein [Streptomyces sp. NRRL S-87]|uniref:hypothetical protein n=1 Tax=Streptomyces sp. NRRL S-87 TaxID=1463920 RepID=UPI0004BF16B3|nr:hypothetical protein [Streptomyces sp. NRRL S-87]